MGHISFPGLCMGGVVQELVRLHFLSWLWFTY